MSFAPPNPNSRVTGKMSPAELKRSMLIYQAFQYLRAHPVSVWGGQGWDTTDQHEIWEAAEWLADQFFNMLEHSQHLSNHTVE